MTGLREIKWATFVTAVLLVTVVFVAPSSAAADAQRVEQLRSELNKINDEFKKAGAAYDNAFWALDETEKAIEEATGRIAANEAELANAQDVLQNRIAAWYRADDLGGIEFVLGARDFSDLLNRFDYVSRIAHDDATAIQRVEELLAQLRVDRERLETEQAKRSERAEKFKGERDALQRRLQDKRAEYDRLQAEMREEARKAEAARQRAAASVSRPLPVRGITGVPGPNGMVFPVAGPNYYSDTWGASRDGGRRRHKGTDIMAATGVPVVATLSGTLSRGDGSKSGLYLRLRADNGWTFYYMHLDSIIISSGRVSAGQTIGTVGYSGNASASAPHLHFEIHLPGRGAVNPYPYLRQMQGR
ncbi:MAG: peptidoglycan DD-metalloendopeptidase family protein [Clostridiales bacterium]|nr:peptidoglycan DD-metalloendopeptidase family protein [Clostridiales bacterium]